MTPSEAIAWFEQIEARQIRKVAATEEIIGNVPIYFYDDAEAINWITDAQSALEAVFPDGHAVLKLWRAALSGNDGNPGALSSGIVVSAVRGVFRSALGQLKAGRLSTLVEGIRAESTNDLLDQALTLLAGKYAIAAAVIGGGALETHLLHYCQKNNLAWLGEGSIAAYDQAVAQARNAGSTQVYSVTDTKLIVGWGGIRNDAAHKPGDFNRSVADVERMIQGIREFIARNP